MASFRERRPQIRLIFGVYWGLGLLGCQVVFGDYQAGHAAAGSAGAAPMGGTAVAGGGASAGAGGSLGGTAGIAGAFGGTAPTGGSGGHCSGTQPYRCSGALLQQCTASVWTTIDTCKRPALCQPTLGVCDACADGERNCTGSVLAACNADHTAFATIDTCSSPLYCDATVDHCVACATDQARCNGVDYLAVCYADRSGWDLQAQACTFGCYALDGMADYCADCPAGSPPACASPTTLRSCISGKWRAEACPNGCVDATGTTPAACLN